jgi:molybdopterin-containing oxidoreductase family iron-sulfur binding subunit
MTGRHSEESKRNFALMRERILAQQGQNYWRSLEEMVDAPEFEEFVSREFPQHAENWDDPVSRRSFLKIMGASLALAGLSSACVIQPPEKVIPFVRQPEELIPGKASFFATAMSLGGTAVGLLARSNGGKPTKIEGNPQHPGSLGSTDVLAQGSLLTMYDPDRSTSPVFRGQSRSWADFVKALQTTLEPLRGNGGAGVRFLTESINSPTIGGQMKQILTEMPNARWYQYEPVSKDNAKAGAVMALGQSVNTVYKFDVADRVLSLDSDFLSSFNVRYVRDFSAKRRVSEEKKDMNRLYVAETTISITGAKADHRLAVKPSQMEGFAKAVAAALGVSGASSNYTENAPWIAAMAKDLQANRGKSIVIAGDNQPPVIHALAHAMNAALGNVGQTVFYTDPIEYVQAGTENRTQIDGLRELVKEIDAGAVQVLVMVGGNPVYNTPSDLKFTFERLEKVPFRVHLSLFRDETSEISHWHINETHYLEQWGDAHAYDGTVTLQQPLVAPLYDGISASEFLQAFMKQNSERRGLDILKEMWQKPGSPMVQGKFEDNWRKAVHDGFVGNTALPAKTFSVKTDFMNQTANIQAGSGNTLEVSILPDPSVYDGRFANNGWMQELPKPLNKVTWDNIVLVSPKTAERLNLNQNRKYQDKTAGAEEGAAFFTTKGGNLNSDLVNLKVNGQTLSKPVPVWIQPGQPDDVLTVYLGYGRKSAGRVGSGLGYDAYEVRSSNSLNFAVGEISKTGNQYPLASTQTHFNMEGRDILQVWNIENAEEKAKVMEHKAEEFNNYEKSMYDPYSYTDAEWKHKWGMSVDLNACVGCNACVIACQSENNIPVVGKEQVERSREMHWMRVDAYYGGTDANNPEGPHFQPMLCQQCEQAPCEPVCPVHATVHSAEGLNDMVYNRCVGTRYCSNNCPYKVRRFNFLLYQDWYTPQYKLMRNPEVSVRSRGVMEKCNYCTQRIAMARIEAQKDGNRRVKDGEVLTACQSVCPAEAIIFGDLNDPQSKVSKWKKEHRNYNVLNELNTQPRTTYLASLRNPNKEMPDYKPVTSKTEEHGGGEKH